MNNPIKHYPNARNVTTMDNLRLVIPTIKLQDDVMKFRQEFIDNKERISGGVGLEQATNYNDWLNHKYIPHYGKVDEVVFLAYNNDTLVGISDIRLTSNDFVNTYAGQIGYSVLPSLRGKGYATKMLKLTLKKAKQYNFNKILITCNEPNIASAKVIERNGGILEKIIPHPGFPNVKRYYIDLNE